MTDKVQKIREEVVRMHNLLPIMDGDNISVNYADRICTTLEMYIDSLQEEPASNPIDFEKELYKAFGQVKDFTLGMRIAKRFYDMGKKSLEPVSEKWIEELRTKLDSMSKEDCKRVFDKYAINFDEEPVSEDLKEAADDALNSILNTHGIVNVGSCLDMFKLGAKWQKERMLSNTIDTTI